MTQDETKIKIESLLSNFTEEERSHILYGTPKEEKPKPVITFTTAGEDIKNWAAGLPIGETKNAVNNPDEDTLKITAQDIKNWASKK